jgi:hypothetical protein
MAQQFLDHSQVGLPFQHMAGEGMAQSMGMHPVTQPGAGGIPALAFSALVLAQIWNFTPR